MQPLIGITTGVYTDSNTSWVYHRAYAVCSQAIVAAGGLPVLIPSGLANEVLRAIYERLDALLLPGGGDIDPQHYNAAPHPTIRRLDTERDGTELTLARWAVEDDRPLFGICRGHQAINVALGGTLVQDIPDQLHSTLSHDVPNDVNQRNLRLHDVAIDPHSRLAQIVGSTALQVNSLHHQSVSQPAPGVCITAYSPDGVVEALEFPDKHFALSVQWHPEDLYLEDEANRRLFQAFVEAARERARR